MDYNNTPLSKTVPLGPPALKPVQPAWEKWLKRTLAGVVGACGALVVTASPGSLEAKVCTAVVGFGAALGITSRGVEPKR